MPRRYRFSLKRNYHSCRKHAFVVFSSPATNAFTPNTNTVGTTTYYVSQSNARCESDLAAINVIVLEKPAPGEIAYTGGLVCEGEIPSQAITSSSPASSTNGSLAYQWEVSTDGGTT